MGRRPKNIDRNEVMKLAFNGNSIEAIGRLLGCSGDTISSRFRKELEQGWERGRAALNAVMMDEALNKRNTAIIRDLADRRFGKVQTKIELTGDTTKPVAIQNKNDLTKLTTEELEALNNILEKTK
jgi:DNA-binding Lrp family transcriptional regulator